MSRASPGVHEARAAEAADVAPRLRRDCRAEFRLRPVGEGREASLVQAEREATREHEIAGDPHQAREARGMLAVDRRADFALWELTVEEVRLIAGFGEIKWLPGSVVGSGE